MGIFKKIEKRKSEKKLTNIFKLLTGYSPICASYEGGLYEMGLLELV